MSVGRKNEDPLRRFVLPHVYSNSASAVAASFSGTRGGKPLQAPPTDRGELKAFQSNARGTANVLVPVKVNDSAVPTGKERSINDVWRKSLFSHAPQIAEIDPSDINRVHEDGSVNIVRYLPDRFECGRVQAPQMVVERVDAALLTDEGAHLMHPQVRRAAHDALVNARQGELALREGLRARTKMVRTCRMNFPHGALGLAESPYVEPSDVFVNAAELQRQNQATIRKGKGGHAPPDTMGRTLSGEEPAPLGRSGKAPGAFRPRDSINFEEMFKVGGAAARANSKSQSSTAPSDS